MLSDREREVLNEIQRQFLLEDPGLAKSLAAGQQPRSATQLRFAYTVTIVVAIALGGLVLLAGSVLGALVFAAVAVGVALARHCQVDTP